MKVIRGMIGGVVAWALVAVLLVIPIAIGGVAGSPMPTDWNLIASSLGAVLALLVLAGGGIGFLNG